MHNPVHAIQSLRRWDSCNLNIFGNATGRQGPAHRCCRAAHPTLAADAHSAGMPRAQGWSEKCTTRSMQFWAYRDGTAATCMFWVMLRAGRGPLTGAAGPRTPPRPPMRTLPACPGRRAGQKNAKPCPCNTRPTEMGELQLAHFWKCNGPAGARSPVLPGRVPHLSTPDAHCAGMPRAQGWSEKCKTLSMQYKAYGDGIAAT